MEAVLLYDLEREVELRRTGVKIKFFAGQALNLQNLLGAVVEHEHNLEQRCISQASLRLE